MRGGTSREVELAFTAHGPVIHVDAAKKRAYAVRSAWLEPGMSPLLRLPRIHARARTSRLSSARSSTLGRADARTRSTRTPRATSAGRRAGLAPKRPNWDGLLPVPGDGRYEWGGIWRGDDMPVDLQPAAGLHRHRQCLQHSAGLPGHGAQARLRVDQPFTLPTGDRGAGRPAEGLDRGFRAAAKRHPLDSGASPREAARAAVLGRREDEARAGLPQGVGRPADLGFATGGTRGLWQLRHLRKGFREAVLKPEAAPRFRSPT